MSESQGTGGYVSEESKRRFTIWAGILGVVFFLVQIFLPMIAMFAIMPGFFVRSEFVSYACCGGQALFDGKLYLVEETTAVTFGDTRVRTRLVRLDGDDVEEVADLGDEKPALLATPGGLLLITSASVRRLDGSTLTKLGPSAPLGEISTPFPLVGSAGVVEYLPDRRRELLWEGSDWREVREYPRANGPERTGFLSVEGRLREFHRKEQTLWYRDLDGADAWEVVSSKTEGWSVLPRNGRPAAVVADGEHLHLYVRDPLEGWQEEPSVPFSGRTLSLFEALPGPPGEPLTIVSSRFPTNVRIDRWGDDGLEQGARVGSSSPFPASMIAGMWMIQTVPVLLSLALAVVLSALMRTHRTGEVTVGTRTVVYASLTRRALAQMIDAAIAIAPPALLGFTILFHLEDLAEASEGPEILFWMFGAMATMLVWLGVVMVAYSFGEGRWGRTPGKWATGIRVLGTDLRPCGFGRAIVRNLLKMVDGFFNYLIGILMVAFTPEWQRLGDLAARTIVVRTQPEPERDRSIL